MTVKAATSKTEIKQTSDMSTVLFLLKLPPFVMQEFPLAATNSFICRVYERKLNNTFSRLKNLSRRLLWFKKLSLNVFYENDFLIKVFENRIK